jgi:hypothetical protein
MKAKERTNAELDRMSEVKPADKVRARELWAEQVKDENRNLLEAVPVEETGEESE